MIQLKHSGLASLVLVGLGCGDRELQNQGDTIETEAEVAPSDVDSEGSQPDSGLSVIELRPLALWGKRGGPGNQPGYGGGGAALDDFADPTGLDLSLDESELYVVDSGNDRIKVYDLNGNVLRSFSHPGSSNDLVVGLDGTLYTWNRETKAIVGYDPYGILRYSWSLLDGGDSDTGYSISIDADGLVYIGDSVFGQVSVYSPDGVYVRRMGERGERKGEFPNGPNGLAVVGTLVYGSSFGELLVFSSNGQYLYEVEAPRYEPNRMHEGGIVAWNDWCVALLWNEASPGYGFYAIEPGASDVTHVAAVPQGRGFGQMDLPSRFVIDSQGRWYVSERNNSRVQVLQGPLLGD